MIIDTDKLHTVQNFAKKRGVAIRTVYYWIEKGYRTPIEISGVQFLEWLPEDEVGAVTGYRKPYGNK